MRKRTTLQIFRSGQVVLVSGLLAWSTCQPILCHAQSSPTLRHVRLFSSISTIGFGKLNGAISKLICRQSPVRMSTLAGKRMNVVVSRYVDPLRLKLRIVSAASSNEKWTRQSRQSIKSTRGISSAILDQSLLRGWRSIPASRTSPERREDSAARELARLLGAGQ